MIRQLKNLQQKKENNQEWFTNSLLLGLFAQFLCLTTIIIQDISFYQFFSTINLKSYFQTINRHGESVWNKSNQFTGWTDVDLTETGVAEAKLAGELLKKDDYKFDIIFTSVLKRAIKTMNVVTEEIDQLWVPVIRSFRLNERHYGGLQGLNKSQTSEKHGEEQVKIWRRSFDIPPPALSLDDPRHPIHDPKYQNVDKSLLPDTESLKTTIERFMPLWNEQIAPEIKSGKNVLIVAHGNSLRALVKYLDKVPEGEIVELNIPTGVPLVYELDDELKPIKHYYLLNEEEVKKKIAAVAAQASVKK